MIKTNMHYCACLQLCMIRLLAVLKCGLCVKSAIGNSEEQGAGWDGNVAAFQAAVTCHEKKFKSKCKRLIALALNPNDINILAFTKNV